MSEPPPSDLPPDPPLVPGATTSAAHALFLDRTFHVHADDHVLTALAPELLPRLRALAPGVKVELAPLPERLPDPALPEAEDVYVVAGPPRASRYVQQALYRDDLVGLARPHHPSLVRRGQQGEAVQGMDLDAFLACRQVDVVGVAAEAVEDVMAAAGLSRRVAVRVHSALLAAQLVPGTDRLAVVPHGFARRIASQLGLVVVDLPMALPPLELSLMWHPDHTEDAGHLWFRKRLRESAERLDRRHHDARFGPR